jgi:hypothetical protein
MVLVLELFGLGLVKPSTFTETLKTENEHNRE